MKNKKRRTSFMLIWMLFTAVLLTATSYAWFSTNRLLTIKSFNIHVASKGGIEISTDAINWKGVLTLTDLTEARTNYPNSVNQIPDVLEPVSTSGAIENGFLKLFTGEVSSDGLSDDYVLTGERSIEQEGFGTATNGKFVAFDLFFKNISEKTIFLTPQSGIFYLADIGTGIENAFRVAFLNEGNMSIDSSVTAIQNLRGATSAFLWEPNYDTHTLHGVEHARRVYGIEVSETSGRLLEYYGIKNAIRKEDGIKLSATNSGLYPNFLEKANINLATPKNFRTFEKILDLKPGITKVRVYIWIEGQDVDCEDNASVADISIDLQMTTDPS